MPIGTPKLGTLAEGTAATLAVPYPTGLSANDVAVLFVSTFFTPPAVPAGWTSRVSLSRSTNTTSPSILVATRTLTGSETGSVTVNTSTVAALGRILAVSGVDTTTPMDVTPTTYDSNASNGTSVPIPGLTTTMTGVMLLAYAAITSTGATMTPPTAPSAFTEYADRATGTRSASGHYLLWSGSGATGTVTVPTSGNTTRIGALVALRPAGGAAVGTQGFWGVRI